MPLVSSSFDLPGKRSNTVAGSAAFRAFVHFGILAAGGINTWLCRLRKLEHPHGFPFAIVHGNRINADQSSACVITRA